MRTRRGEQQVRPEVEASGEPMVKKRRGRKPKSAIFDSDQAELEASVASLKPRPRPVYSEDTDSCSNYEFAGIAKTEQNFYDDSNKENIPPQVQVIPVKSESNQVQHDVPAAFVVDANGQTHEFHVSVQHAEDGGDGGSVIDQQGLMHLANLIAQADQENQTNESGEWDSSAQYSISYSESGEISFHKEPMTYVSTPYPARGECTNTADSSGASEVTLPAECRVLFDASFDSQQPTVVYAATSTPLPTVQQESSASFSTDDGDESTSFRSVNRKTALAYGDVDFIREKGYNPSMASRNSHNEKERRRRSRMKFSCQMLRNLVPGVEEKTDKATVLEHTVHYLLHLHRCSHVQCTDYIPQIPPPMITKVQYVQTPQGTGGVSIHYAVCQEEPEDEPEDEREDDEAEATVTEAKPEPVKEEPTAQTDRTVLEEVFTDCEGEDTVMMVSAAVEEAFRGMIGNSQQDECQDSDNSVVKSEPDEDYVHIE